MLSSDRGAGNGGGTMVSLVLPIALSSLDCRSSTESAGAGTWASSGAAPCASSAAAPCSSSVATTASGAIYVVAPVGRERDAVRVGLVWVVPQEKVFHYAVNAKVEI
jgi:hypothetical protein